MTDDASSAERAAGWRPIETAPRDGTRVLLWTDTRSSHGLDVYYAIGGEDFAEIQVGFWEAVANYPMRQEPAGWRTPMIGHPTHWQPLPAPPDPQEHLARRGR